MKFVNNTGKKKLARIKSPTDLAGCRWVTVKPEQEIELPKQYGKNLGFKLLIEQEVKKSNESKEKSNQIKSDKKVESVPKKKPVQKKKSGKGKEKRSPRNPRYLESLKTIKGIGQKTAMDIIRIFPQPKDLRKAIKKGLELPIRDDSAKKIKEQW